MIASFYDWEGYRMEHHEPFLREAIALSKSAMQNGDEPFGAVLVKGSEVIRGRAPVQRSRLTFRSRQTN